MRSGWKSEVFCFPLFQFLVPCSRLSWLKFIMLLVSFWSVCDVYMNKNIQKHIPDHSQNIEMHRNEQWAYSPKSTLQRESSVGPKQAKSNFIRGKDLQQGPRMHRVRPVVRVQYMPWVMVLLLVEYCFVLVNDAWNWNRTESVNSLTHRNTTVGCVAHSGECIWNGLCG